MAASGYGGSLVVLVVVVLVALTLQAHVEEKILQRVKRIIDHSDVNDGTPDQKLPRKARVGQFPWQVLLSIRGRLKNGNSTDTTCGGSIINENWILTAAHCLAEEVKGSYHLSTTILYVYAGVTNKSKKKEGQINSFFDDEIVKHVFINPEYNKRCAHDSDIALIKLKKPLIFNDRVKSIDLAKNGEFYHQEKLLIVSGWGRMNEDPLLRQRDPSKVETDVLRFINDLELKSYEFCTDALRSQFFKTITRNMICFNDTKRSLGHGDSGGPIITKRGSSNKPTYVQIGIASWVHSPLSVLVDVAVFRDWIYDTMANSDRYTVFDDNRHRNWQQAKDKCASHGLRMAEPSGVHAVGLRKYILEKYGEGVWLHARGDDTHIRWDGSRGQAIEGSNSLWEPGNYDNRVSKGHCLMLLAWDRSWRNYPNQPFASWNCSIGAITLCETCKYSYTAFNDNNLNWWQANDKCLSKNLTMAKPSEDDAVDLRKYILEKYGEGDVWLNARGDNKHIKWKGGQVIEGSNSLWRPDNPDNRVEDSHCLILMGWDSEWREYPNQPFASGVCSNSVNTITLCENPPPEDLHRRRRQASEQCSVKETGLENENCDITCANGKCIKYEKKCNKVNDCGDDDDTDERGCSFARELTCHICKTWDGGSIGRAPKLLKLNSHTPLKFNGPGSLRFDSECGTTGYSGYTDMAKFWHSYNPYGCLTKIYKDGDVVRTFGQEADMHGNCSKGTEWKNNGIVYEKSQYTRCWCSGTNCNTNLCEECGAAVLVPAECPPGFFKLEDLGKCYRIFHDERRTWFNARSKCEAHQLTLAEPQDPVAMTSYLTTTYGLRYWTWVGARGNGDAMAWENDGDLIINNSSPYWRPGRPQGRVNNRHCAVLQTAPYGLQHYPNNPYNSIWCDHNRQWTLCELPKYKPRRN